MPPISSRTGVTHACTAWQTRGVQPTLLQCWPTVYDGGPTLKQHRSNVLRLHYRQRWADACYLFVSSEAGMLAYGDGSARTAELLVS